MGLKFGASPLGQLLDLYAQADRNAEARPFEQIPVEQSQHLLHLVAQFERLAWAIRALYGREGRVDRMDASFVRAEVLAADTKERDADRVLPGGIGTMMIAGRLVQAGGGSVSVYGNQVAGHDIRWRTATGDLVLVERKDRPYEPGLSDTRKRRVRRVIEEVKKARIPGEPRACRVLSVGFQHLVRGAEMPQLDKYYQRVLRKEFSGGVLCRLIRTLRARGRKNAPPANPPHVVIIEHLGLEPVPGGERNDFFSPQPINLDLRKLSPEMERVLPLLMRALIGDRAD